MSDKPDNHHSPPPPEKTHGFEHQTVVVEDFSAEGYTLAIGGGGEGIIGRLKGDRVVAIDVSEEELREAPEGPLKAIMDARNLTFLDGSFFTVASFFTLMYIDRSDHPAVFREVFRVLRPGGRFFVWDASFGPKPRKEIEIGIVPLTVRLPAEEIETGYGVRWPKETGAARSYESVGEATGFIVERRGGSGNWFFFEFVKP